LVLLIQRRPLKINRKATAQNQSWCN
jgi:hypothetical protein